VEAGDRVVISSQFLIDSESTLKEAIRKIISSKNGAGGSDDASASPMTAHEQ
jgi:hypothetical protein